MAISETIEFLTYLTGEPVGKWAKDHAPEEIVHLLDVAIHQLRR